MTRQYWASYRGDTVGPYRSRDEASEAFFSTFANRKECTVGYGSEGPHFDMGWVSRPDPVPSSRYVASAYSYDRN